MYQDSPSSTGLKYFLMQFNILFSLKESIKEKEESIKEKEQKLTEALETSKAESTSSQAPASSEGMLFHQYNYKNCNILKVS